MIGINFIIGKQNWFKFWFSSNSNGTIAWFSTELWCFICFGLLFLPFPPTGAAVRLENANLHSVEKFVTWNFFGEILRINDKDGIMPRLNYGQNIMPWHCHHLNGSSLAVNYESSYNVNDANDDIFTSLHPYNNNAHCVSVNHPAAFGANLLNQYLASFLRDIYKSTIFGGVFVTMNLFTEIHTSIVWPSRWLWRDFSPSLPCRIFRWTCQR